MIRFFISLSLLYLSACQAQAEKQSIAVSYSPSLDSACSLLRGGTIKDEWKNELLSRKGEFDHLWDDAGPALIRAAEKITEKSFPSGRTAARLTLCDVPSQSFAGISINMRYALKSFAQEPVPFRYKVDTLFHELLHTFLAEHPVKDSNLLRNFDSEPMRVRDHLHLLALQKAVLLSLNEPYELQQVIAIDSQLPGGYYKRAWEIVNATDEEYLKYVAEIKR